MYKYICTCTYGCIFLNTYIYIHVCMYTYTCIYIYIHTHIYIHIYIYIYIHVNAYIYICTRQIQVYHSAITYNAYICCFGNLPVLRVFGGMTHSSLLHPTNLSILLTKATPQHDSISSNSCIRSYAGNSYNTYLQQFIHVTSFFFKSMCQVCIRDSFIAIFCNSYIQREGNNLKYFGVTYIHMTCRSCKCVMSRIFEESCPVCTGVTSRICMSRARAHTHTHTHTHT